MNNQDIANKLVKLYLNDIDRDGIDLYKYYYNLVNTIGPAALDNVFKLISLNIKRDMYEILGYRIIKNMARMDSNQRESAINWLCHAVELYGIEFDLTELDDVDDLDYVTDERKQWVYDNS